MPPALTASDRDELVPVHLRAVPVPLAAKSRRHREELLRVFAFLVADAIETGTKGSGNEVPVRLLDVYLALTQQFAGLNDEAERILTDAIDSGVETIDDLVIELPQEAADIMRSVAETLDEADYYCWSGNELLDLATPDDCLAYRRWCISQILDQLSGRHPVRWPDSAAARSLHPRLN
ncbi:MAG: hypothetical protein QOJ79_893 [Actinomycetota bacterium]|jgi:hypothetical protein|nr:hypothetical protein [Actinomycetota bacterium]